MNTYEDRMQREVNAQASFYVSRAERVNEGRGQGVWRRTLRRLGTGHDIWPHITRAMWLICARNADTSLSTEPLWLTTGATEPKEARVVRWLDHATSSNLMATDDDIFRGEDAAVYSALTSVKPKSGEAMVELCWMLKASNSEVKNIGQRFRSLALEVSRAFKHFEASGVALPESHEMEAFYKELESADTVLKFSEIL
jgi:hypothetical protein